MKFIHVILVATVGATGVANATEGGGSIYPVGSENYTCCALPPPGVYGMVYAQRYSADKVRGNDGQVVTPDGFKITAVAIAPRLIWVSPTEMAGAAVKGVHAILPLVDLKVTVAPGTSQSKSGVGDMVFGPFLAWHHSKALHSVAGLDIFAPTGRYRSGDLANIGRNYWAVQPVLGASYIDPNGVNADAKAMWTYNFKNKDMRQRLPHPTADQIDVPGSALKLSATPVTYRRSPPLLGQHTDEVLQSLADYSSAELSALKQRQII